MAKPSFSDPELGARITEVVEKLGGKSEAVRKIGASYPSISKWCDGEADPSRTNLIKLAEIGGVDLVWLATGIKPTESNPHAGTGSYDVACRQSDMNEPISKEYVHIPVYDIEVSAGHGMFSDGVQHARKHLAFRRRWIKARNLQVDRLAVLFTKGDSMTPTIPENAAIVIDMARNQALDGKVYVIRINDRLYVKRTQWLPPAGLRLISDNKHYDSIDISKSDFAANDVEVIGQVIHAAYDLPD